MFFDQKTKTKETHLNYRIDMWLSVTLLSFELGHHISTSFIWLETVMFKQNVVNYKALLKYGTQASGCLQ